MRIIPNFATQHRKRMKQIQETLTKAEFDIMSKLWEINHSACVNDILERFEDPKPAYTTIATYMKKLQDKGFVDYYKVQGGGKTKMYVAKVQKAEYTRRTMDDVKKNFFGGSLKSMLSFFVKEEQLTEEDVRKLLDIIKE